MRTLFALGVVVSVAPSAPARATTIDPLSWEELVTGADLVAVVECVTAGGIVARYRIAEAWKGPVAVGSEVVIRTAVNYWEPQYPLALVGERRVVTAYRAAPLTMASTTMGGPVPLWWRHLPADYELPLFQGASRVDGTQVEGDVPVKDLAQLRTRTRQFLAAGAEEREAAILASLVRSRLRGGDKLAGLAARPLVEALLERAGRARGEEARQIGYLLERAGGTVTLAIVEGKGGRRLPARARREVVIAIKRRLAPPAPPAAPEPVPPEPPPSAAELARLRKLVAGTPTQDAFDEAFEALTVHDPAAIVPALVSWTNPKRGWQDADLGYAIGSYFGWRCGRDRATHLRALLKARDEFIRVSAAVYLAFEDEKEGMARLAELARLPGDPGGWAALNLARRGDKRGVGRLLEVLATPGGTGMASVPHRNLRKRILELFSNSAKASGVPQPVPPLVDDEGVAAAPAYRDWWKKHGDRVKLVDPWLPALRTQKVD